VYDVWDTIAMEKQTVQKLLDAKSHRLRFEPYEGGKSKLWASFVVATAL